MAGVRGEMSPWLTEGLAPGVRGETWPARPGPGLELELPTSTFSISASDEIALRFRAEIFPA